MFPTLANQFTGKFLQLDAMKIFCPRPSIPQCCSHIFAIKKHNTRLGELSPAAAFTSRRYLIFVPCCLVVQARGGTFSQTPVNSLPQPVSKSCVLCTSFLYSLFSSIAPAAASFQRTSLPFKMFFFLFYYSLSSWLDP